MAKKLLLLIAILCGLALGQDVTNNTSNRLTTALPNGNIAGANISKISLKTLLPAGSKALIIAHLENWWGSQGHINIGYDSRDPIQNEAQIQDMLSRGIDGVMINWYGKGSFSDIASLVTKKAAEAHPGFKISMDFDGGTLKYRACTGCNATQTTIYHLKYIAATYYTSPSYLRDPATNRPIITFFSMEQWPVDWNAVRAAVGPEPMFIFRNSSGWGKTQSSGAFAWLGISSTTMGLGYIDDFYWNALRSDPKKVTFGSAWKGFDDSIASWGSHRLTQQFDGKTWLATWSEMGKYFNSSTTLPVLDYVQLVTWNDYEEGTALETGVENNITVSLTRSGSVLTWGASDESTVDHYNVYMNGIQLFNLPLSTHSMDVSTLKLLPDETYNFTVEAYGKPMITNHISSSIAVTPKVCYN